MVAVEMKSPSYAIGVDPGATVGLALVECHDAWLLAPHERGAGEHLGRVVEATSTRGSSREIAMWVVFALGSHPDATVAIERPRGGAYSPSHVGPLLDAAWVGGEVSGFLDRAFNGSLARRDMPASQWRTRIVGKPNARPREVEQALRAWVDLPKRSNEHGRDAVGVAIAGWLLARG